MQTNTALNVAPVKRSTVQDVKLVNKEIYVFAIHRSICSKLLFNVVALDKKGVWLATVQPDISFDDAVEMVEVLNSGLNN